jgi:hypothetical protein
MSQPHSERAVDAAVVERVLTDGDVETIAKGPAAWLAEILSAAPGTFALVDARQLARDLGVPLDYVYAHATELGAPCLGSERPPNTTGALNVVELKPGVIAQFGYEDIGQLVVQMRARRSIGRGSRSAIASTRPANDPAGCRSRGSA